MTIERLELPELDLLNRLLTYDPETGHFWRKTRHGGGKLDRPAGCAHVRGYWSVKVKGQRILAHRLAWKMHYGEEPPDHIDHRNGDKADNRAENLRAAEHFENHANVSTSRSDSTTGRRGVNVCTYSDGSTYYQARAQVRGKRINLGLFSRPEYAEAAYRIFRTAIDGDFHPSRRRPPD